MGADEEEHNAFSDFVSASDAPHPGAVPVSAAPQPNLFPTAPSAAFDPFKQAAAPPAAPAAPPAAFFPQPVLQA